MSELREALAAYENEVGDRGMPFNTGWFRILDAVDALEAEVERKLLERADAAFEPETAQDSDGHDQAERAGVLAALDTVKEIFNREGANT